MTEHVPSGVLTLLASGLIALAGCRDESKDQPTPAAGSITAPAEATVATTSTAADEIPSGSATDALFEPEPGFKMLKLADFEIFYSKAPGDAVVWTEDGNVIRCAGKPRGYLHSKETFRNITWRAEYRFVPDPAVTDAEKLAASNTGFMLYITGKHKQWPVSLEVQGKHVEMCSIKANGGAANVEIADDPAARDAARKPVGEWNSVEIITHDGGVTSFLNGKKICESQPGELTEGSIGLQSEDFPVEFRYLRVKVE